MNKRWIAYGVTGVVGLGVIAGGATVAASGMELHTETGQVLPGGSITSRAGAGTPHADVPEKGSAASDSRADARASTGSDTAPTAITPPTPVTPPSAPAQVSPISPASVASAASNDD